MTYKLYHKTKIDKLDFESYYLRSYFAVRCRDDGEADSRRMQMAKKPTVYDAAQTFINDQDPKNKGLQDALGLDQRQTELLFAALTVLEKDTGRRIPNLNTTAKEISASPWYHIKKMDTLGFFENDGTPGQWSVTKHAMKLVTKINAAKGPLAEASENEQASPKRKQRGSPKKRHAGARKKLKQLEGEVARRRAARGESAGSEGQTADEVAALSIADMLAQASLGEVTAHVKRRLGTINDQIAQIRRESEDQIKALESERDEFMAELRRLIGELTDADLQG